MNMCLGCVQLVYLTFPIITLCCSHYLYLYIYKIEAKKVLGNATTHRALVLSSWNFNTDPAQYGTWTLVKIIRIGPRVPGLEPYLGRALSFGESFWSFEMRLCGKIWMAEMPAYFSVRATHISLMQSSTIKSYVGEKEGIICPLKQSPG